MIVLSKVTKLLQKEPYFWSGFSPRTCKIPDVCRCLSISLPNISCLGLCLSFFWMCNVLYVELRVLIMLIQFVHSVVDYGRGQQAYPQFCYSCTSLDSACWEGSQSAKNLRTKMRWDLPLNEDLILWKRTLFEQCCVTFVQLFVQLHWIT